MSNLLIRLQLENPLVILNLVNIYSWEFKMICVEQN
jgi:hypothetical protein